MTDLKDLFEKLVADLDYPMYVVTASFDGERAGCLVGFATQASIDPPRLLVLVSKANETFRIASRADVLGVHFLGADNKDLAELFGEESGDWTDKFARCDWQDGPGGVPVLVGVRGWVAGRVLERLDAGDHVAHLLEPIDAGFADGQRPLMLQTVTDLDAGHSA
ncbi:MAG TPA: flavin reductase family protein [Mycobacteriales bacterium]|nr:flavin reductase family protein [Mycobacteriales bacterium]